MPNFSLDVGEGSEYKTLEDEDFFDPESIKPGVVPKINPDKRLINPGDDSEQSMELELGDEAVSKIKDASEKEADDIKDAIKELKAKGTLDQISMESLHVRFPDLGLLPSKYCTEYPSKIHYDDTLSKLENRLKN